MSTVHEPIAPFNNPGTIANGWGGALLRLPLMVALGLVLAALLAFWLGLTFARGSLMAHSPRHREMGAFRNSLPNHGLASFPGSTLRQENPAVLSISQVTSQATAAATAATPAAEGYSRQQTGPAQQQSSGHRLLPLLAPLTPRLKAGEDQPSAPPREQAHAAMVEEMMKLREKMAQPLVTGVLEELVPRSELDQLFREELEKLAQKQGSEPASNQNVELPANETVSEAVVLPGEQNAVVAGNGTTGRSGLEMPLPFARGSLPHEQGPLQPLFSPGNQAVANLNDMPASVLAPLPDPAVYPGRSEMPEYSHYPHAPYPAAPSPVAPPASAGWSALGGLTADPSPAGPTHVNWALAAVPPTVAWAAQPRPIPYPPVAGPLRIDHLRRIARNLDESAADLEDLGMFELADQVREAAANIRSAARRNSQDQDQNQNPVPSGIDHQNRTP